jgi:hypothetical protein
VKQSNRVSHYFRARLGDSEPGRCCVALLAPSSVCFMLIWLGLMRGGFEVLLIAYVRTKPSHSNQELTN